MVSTDPGAQPPTAAASPTPGPRISPLYQPKTREYRRYLWTFALGGLAVSLMWGATGSVLLPLHVQTLEFARIFGAHSGVDLTALNALQAKVQSGVLTPNAEQRHQLALLAQFNASRATSLSLVTSIPVFIGAFLQPIIGTFSDRTRSRWGRRAPYLAGGAIAGAALLCLLPLVPSVALLVVLWTFVQLAGTIAQGPLGVTVADRVPEERLASVSALSGLVSYLAAIVGAVAAGALFNAIGLGAYYPFAVTMILFSIPFLLLARDRSSKGMTVKAIRVRTVFASFIYALKDRDYRWAWIAKVLLWAGFGISSAYGVYMLQSYIHPALSTAQAASTAPLLQTVALPGTLIGMAIVGRLSDRLGRRKPFVIAASLLIGVGFLVPWVWPSLPAMFIQSGLAGIGLGVFLVVDQALFIDLLPDRAAAGRDLGMSALAQNVGQAIGPAVAGVVVTVAAGSYGPVWPAGIVIVVISTLAILPIRRAR